MLKIDNISLLVHQIKVADPFEAADRASELAGALPGALERAADESRRRDEDLRLDGRRRIDEALQAALPDALQRAADNIASPRDLLSVQALISSASARAWEEQIERFMHLTNRIEHLLNDAEPLQHRLIAIEEAIHQLRDECERQREAARAALRALSA